MATADPADELKKYHAKYLNDLLSHKFILEMAAFLEKKDTGFSGLQRMNLMLKVDM